MVVNRNWFMNLSNRQIDELMIDMWDDLIYIRESSDYDDENPEAIVEYNELENRMNQCQSFHYEKFGYYHNPENCHVY